MCEHCNTLVQQAIMVNKVNYLCYRELTLVFYLGDTELLLSVLFQF